MIGFGPSGVAKLTRRAALGIGATLGLALFAPWSAQAAEPIKVGLVTALSGQSARAGEALTRGFTIAIDEINAKGGILGRQVELVRRDDEANPAKGVIAARELVQREKVAVLFGGLDTPVALAIVRSRMRNAFATSRMSGVQRSAAAVGVAARRSAT